MNSVLPENDAFTECELLDHRRVNYSVLPSTSSGWNSKMPYLPLTRSPASQHKCRTRRAKVRAYLAFDPVQIPCVRRLDSCEQSHPCPRVVRFPIKWATASEQPRASPRANKHVCTYISHRLWLKIFFSPRLFTRARGLRRMAFSRYSIPICTCGSREPTGHTLIYIVLG